MSDQTINAVKLALAGEVSDFKEAVNDILLDKINESVELHKISVTQDYMSEEEEIEAVSEEVEEDIDMSDITEEDIDTYVDALSEEEIQEMLADLGLQEDSREEMIAEISRELKTRYTAKALGDINKQSNKNVADASGISKMSIPDAKKTSIKMMQRAAKANKRQQGIMKAVK